jgi:hypothetical protein
MRICRLLKRVRAETRENRRAETYIASTCETIERNERI